MDVFEAITSRRSIRSFTGDPVSEEDVAALLDAAHWAPSGLNNQPWKFTVVRDEEIKEKLAECTKYADTYRAANLGIAVYLDHDASYDRTKDVQAIGAAIQNMLLAAHERGLGAVWQGEILNQREQAEALLNPPEGLELMAVVLVGHPAQIPAEKPRKSLEDLTVPRR